MNKPETHHLEVKRTARYFTLGTLSPATKRVWIVLHGFGQMGESFIQQFSTLADDENYIVAPEALNKYYLKSSIGTVGATWMTKEDRLNEIKDYCAYLDQLYAALNLQQFNGEIIALGFSQGASTVTRWVHQSSHRFSKLVVYAGEVGAEVFPLSENSGLRKTKNYFVYGTRDEFFSPETFNLMIEKYTSLEAEIVSFEGTHVINPQLLAQLFK
ncbi:MAG: phospholipase [Bacteroidetes bacterium]|nr:phospholipase [Bacteroidota bacterium]